jgi:hypothetical protein
VASPTSTRIWRTLKAAGKPFPDFTDDDVLNYLITEAVFIKATEEEAVARKQAEKEREREDWKKEQQEQLKQYR